jgi:hypothetical protein
MKHTSQDKEDMDMEQLIQQLLTDLERIGEQAPQLYDVTTRQAIRDVLQRGFVKNEHGYHVPDTFSLDTVQANDVLRKTLIRFLEQANEAACSEENPFQRLALIQNTGALSPIHEKTFDDFYGYWTDVDTKRWD